MMYQSMEQNPKSIENSKLILKSSLNHNENLSKKFLNMVFKIIDFIENDFLELGSHKTL